MDNRNLSYHETFLRVCVDSAENTCLTGRVYGMRMAQPLFFSDVPELLLGLERLMDSQNYPQAFQRRRGFSEEKSPPLPQGAMAAEEVERQQGRLYTMQLLVSARQNSSWQGFVDFLDGGGKRSFDSELALLDLMFEQTGRGAP